MIKKPMKGDEAVLDKLRFPLLATPKFDGIRCLKLDGKALSASLKPIRNKFIATWIVDNCPDGFDGELTLRSGAPIGEVNSAVMSRDGEPDFIYNVFDYLMDGKLETPYSERMDNLRAWIHFSVSVTSRFKFLLPHWIANAAELDSFENACIQQGYEGVMVRSPDGPYKCGRSTVREGYLLKIKRFVDAEAVVEGFVEQMHNANEQTRNELGMAERSTAKAGLVPAGVLGALVVRDRESGVEFELGSGFTAAQRADIWRAKRDYLGKTVTYKYQAHGVKDKPRIPIFKFFRDLDDMS